MTTDRNGTENRTNATSARDAWVFIASVVLAAVVPWLVRHWPSQDGQNHLAVAYIVRHFADAGSPFPKYLTIQTGLRPSTAIYSVLVALGSFVTLQTAEKMLASFAIALVPAALYLFLKRNLPERLPNVFLFLPFSIGWAFGMGFLSFEIALGFGVLALAFGWAPDKTKTAITPAHLIASVAYLLCIWWHPVTGLLIGLALLLLEWQTVWSLRHWPRLIGIVGPGVLFLAVEYFRADAPPLPSALPPETYWTVPFWRVITDITEFIIAYTPFEMIPRGIVLLLFLYYVFQELRRARGPKGAVGAGQIAWLLGTAPEAAATRAFVVFFILYHAMPTALSGWFFCSTRFLLVAFLFMPAAAALPERILRNAVPLGAALSVLALAIQLPNIASTSQQMQDILDVGELIPHGSRVIPMDFAAREMGPQPLGHSWAELVWERDAVASQIFAAGKPRMGGERFRTLSFLPGVLDANKGTLPWSTYETWYDVVRGCRDFGSERCKLRLDERKTTLLPAIAHYDYMLMLDPPEYAKALVEGRVELVRHIGSAWLYRVLSSVPAP